MYNKVQGGRVYSVCIKQLHCTATKDITIITNIVLKCLLNK